MITTSTEARYLLSPMQQGMLFHAISGTGVDIEQIVVMLHEDLQVAVFKEALVADSGPAFGLPHDLLVGRIGISVPDRPQGGGEGLSLDQLPLMRVAIFRSNQAQVKECKLR